MLTPGRFVGTDGASLWSTMFGTRSEPVIVAIGGWTGSSDLWLGPIGLLSRRARCIAYDHRGTGRTTSSVSITHRRLVDDVFAVMDAHGAGRAVLAAESAGVGVALAAAARHPERVSGLVLVDGYIPANAPGDGDPFVQALRADYPATIAAFVEACVPAPRHERIRAWGRAILAESNPEAAIALLRADVPAPPLDLKTIDAPALLLHCEGDRIAPVDGARAVAAALRRATLRVLDGDEHVPTMTRPAEIADLIGTWLDDLA